MAELAWPAVALLLGAGFLVGFRGPIGRLLERAKELSLGGLKAYKPSETPAQLPPGKAVSDPLEEFRKSFDNPLLLKVEASLRRSLTERGFTDNSPATQTALIKSLAGAHISLHFEQVNAAVWGSQLSLLTVLANRPQGWTREECRPSYEFGRTQNAKAYDEYPFENWLGWLLGNHLIEEGEGVIRVSQGGREYLKWRIDMQRAWPPAP